MLIPSFLLCSSSPCEINWNPVHLPCPFHRCNVSCPSVSLLSCTWPLWSLPRSLLDCFLLVTHRLTVKQRQLHKFWQEKGAISELRPHLSKQESWLEDFSCPGLVWGGNSCSFGIASRAKIDAQGYGLSLVTAQVIQFTGEARGDNAFLLCCYHAHICPPPQWKILTDAIRPLGYTSVQHPYQEVSYVFVKVLILTSGMILPNISVLILK